MYHELSKKEKKIARIFIDKGLDTAFKEGLENCAAVINDWQKRKFNSNDEAYHKLYKVISNKDYQIGRRYNGLTGSRYLITVAQLFSEQIITEEDIQEFSEQSKAAIRAFSISYRRTVFIFRYSYSNTTVLLL